MFLKPLINGCKLIMKLFCGQGFNLHVLPDPGHVRSSVAALGGRHKVQGVRQGAQGAAPSAGTLEPP